MRFGFVACVVVWFASTCTPLACGQRVRLSPRLSAGQTVIYQLEFHESRDVRVDSHVAVPPLPAGGSLDASCLLQVSVVDASARGFRLKTYLSERKAQSRAVDSSSAQSDSAPDKLIEVFIEPNGTAAQIKGFDQLNAAQQLAWNTWLARFTSSMTYPQNGVRPGQKWQNDEVEATPSPIASLLWKRTYQYGHDEPCYATNASASKADLCAAIVVHATLSQKSSPKNSTPPDYKLRNLATQGTAAGTNETILYIAKATGLLVRTTEDAQQSMDVMIALADGSNQVHYTIDAKSHSQIQLLPDAPQDVR